jgi:hypothetical protein
MKKLIIIAVLILSSVAGIGQELSWERNFRNQNDSIFEFYKFAISEKNEMFFNNINWSNGTDSFFKIEILDLNSGKVLNKYDNELKPYISQQGNILITQNYLDGNVILRELPSLDTFHVIEKVFLGSYNNFAFSEVTGYLIANNSGLIFTYNVFNEESEILSILEYEQPLPFTTSLDIIGLGLDYSGKKFYVNIHHVLKGGKYNYYPRGAIDLSSKEMIQTDIDLMNQNYFSQNSKFIVGKEVNYYDYNDFYQSTFIVRDYENNIIAKFYFNGYVYFYGFSQSSDFLLLRLSDISYIIFDVHSSTRLYFDIEELLNQKVQHCYFADEIGKIIAVDSSLRCYSGIDLTSVNNPKPNDGKVFPNPTEDVATISFELPRAGYLNSTLCDISGYRLKFESAGYFQSGRVEIPVDLTGIAPGVYFLIIREDSGEIVARKKVVVR